VRFDFLKIGIIGGTFNPVHFGHLINAQVVMEDYGLEKVLFVPSKKPVHKDIDDPVSSDDRCRMVEIAIEGNPGLALSRAEVDRDTPSYTIVTVENMLKTNPEWELHLIIGYDSFLELNTWKDYSRLIGLVPVIVMNRPVAERGVSMPYRGYRNLEFSKNPMIEISSTWIRERISLDRTVRYFLPDGVIEYIMERGLYKS